jgi:hypothetical protein
MTWARDWETKRISEKQLKNLVDFHNEQKKHDNDIKEAKEPILQPFIRDDNFNPLYHLLGINNQ